MHRLSRIRALLLCVLAVSTSAASRGQGTATTPRQAGDLSSWSHVQNLPAKTKVHITIDSGGTTCTLFAVTEDTLTCASGLGSKSAGKVIQRNTVKHIKLTRYGVSTAAGFGIGAATGAAISAASTTRGDWLRGLAIAVFTGIGAVPGAVIGGTTDFTRGPTVYVRQ